MLKPESPCAEIAEADAAAGLRPPSNSPRAKGSRQEDGSRGRAPAMSKEEEVLPDRTPRVSKGSDAKPSEQSQEWADGLEEVPLGSAASDSTMCLLNQDENVDLQSRSRNPPVSRYSDAKAPVQSQDQDWPDDLEEVPLESAASKLICPMNQDEIDDLHIIAERLDLQEMLQMYEFAKVSCSEEEHQDENTGGFCRSAACGLGVDPRHGGYKALRSEITSREDMEELVVAAEALEPQEMLELYELTKKVFCKPEASAAQEKPTMAREESIDVVNSSPIQAALQACAHVDELFGDIAFGEPAPDLSSSHWHAEFSVQITDKNFAIQRLPSLTRQGWRSRYKLGVQIGEGIQARVYKAITKSTSGNDLLSRMGCAWQVASTPQVPLGNKDHSFCGSCAGGHGRVVAAKLFARCGSPAFKQERAAMRIVSVHPNIVRLLESFENDHGEDVLIMEMFDCDLYELYRQWFYPMSALLDRLIARVIKQLLLAIDHLVMCGVNHRDVKLENIMVYNLADLESIEIKLGDFGWACATDESDEQRVCGTLWYAPPELSPDVPGIKKKVSLARVPTGLSDMWSVGVIAYLLHVGHNPFKHMGKGTKPEEALRYASQGQIDTKSSRWRRLAPEARNFIQRLLQVDPHARPTPSEVLKHHYITRWPLSATTSQETLQARIFASRTQWADLDGLQRLGWVAMARAVAEPELDSEIVYTARSSRSVIGDNSAYLLQLAKELAVQPVVSKAWLDVLSFAFRYLDIDGDGLLSARDLVYHIEDGNVLTECSTSSQVHAAASVWVHRWSTRGRSLDLLEFRTALLSKRFCRESSQGTGQLNNERTASRFTRPAAISPSLSLVSRAVGLELAFAPAADEECCWADVLSASGSSNDERPQSVYL